MMKSENEQKSDELFVARNGKSAREEGIDSARSLGIVMGVWLGLFLVFCVFSIFKLLY